MLRLPFSCSWQACLAPPVPPGRAVHCQAEGAADRRRDEESLVGIRASCSCPIPSQRFDSEPGPTLQGPH